MYPSLRHLPSLPISHFFPLFCPYHNPSFSFVTEYYIFCDFSFSYFAHLMAYNSHFPLLLSNSIPSIIQCVTNYFPIILYTGTHSDWLGNSKNMVFIVFLIIYISRVGKCLRFLMCNRVCHCNTALCCASGILTLKQENIKSKAPPVV